MKKKSKSDLEKELFEAKEKLKHLEKKSELIWAMYISSLDELADMRIEDNIRFEYQYECVLSGEANLTEEEEELYLRTNYDRYKSLKKGLIPWKQEWKQEWENASTAEENPEC